MEEPSIRIRDLMLYRRGKLRPFSAVNLDSRGLRKANKTIPYRKEDLYDRVLQMKSEVNTVKTENTRLKTQVKLMETKVTRRVNEDSPLLVENLSRQVIELKKELGNKEQELEFVRKKLKFTKIGEMEAQLQVANDECTRLNRMLMEAMEDLSKGIVASDLLDRYYRLRADYKSLRREFFELSAYVSDSKHTKTTRPGTAKSRKILTDPPKDLSKCPKCGYTVVGAVEKEAEVEEKAGLVQQIWEILREKEMTVGELWKVLDPECLNAIKPNALISGLKAFDWLLTPLEATQLLTRFHTAQGENIHRLTFEETLETELPVRKPEHELLISHFRLRLQGLRMTAGDLETLLKLGERECGVKQLQDRLELSLLRFKREISGPMAEMFFEGYESMPTSRLYRRLVLVTEDIRLLTPEQETVFDSELRGLYAEHRSELMDTLQRADIRSQGVVNFDVFLDASKDVGVHLEPRLEEYLRVLFYADRQELDIVPYETFAQAFCTDQTQ